MTAFWFSIFSLSMLLSGGGAFNVTAEVTEDYGRGVAADQQAQDDAIAFVEMVFELFNASDPSALEYFEADALEMFWLVSDTEEVSLEEAREFIATAVSPATVYEIDDVRTHDQGVVSVRISYQGLGFPREITTARWYLEPDRTGEYRVIQIERQEARVPGDMSVAEVTLVITDRRMQLQGDADDRHETADAVQFVVQNETDMRVTIAIFNTSSNEYVGELPVSAGETVSHTFLLDIGEHLLETYAYEDGAADATPLGARWNETFRRTQGDVVIP